MKRGKVKKTRGRIKILRSSRDLKKSAEFKADCMTHHKCD